MGMLIHNRHYATKSSVSVDNDNTKPVEITSKPVDVVEKVEAENDKIFTKTEINRMSKEDLVALAKEQGIEDELSGSKLKEMLIDKLGL